MGKKRNKKKKSSFFVKFLLVVIILVIFSLGSFLGYSIVKNGGGMQGFLATILGQDMEELQKTEALNTINILLLRYK